jgi:hypothetical protein
MNKVVAVIGGIVAGIVILVVAAGLIAAGLAMIPNQARSAPSGFWVLLGVSLEILKCGLAIWGGYRAYRYLKKAELDIHRLKSPCKRSL